MENRHDGDTKVGENRHLMTTILTRAKSKRTAIATAAVLLAAFLALAWPHAMPTGNKDEGNSAATTQREAAGATEEENETSSVARDGTDEASGPTAEDAKPEETTANERRTTGNGSDVPSSGENGKSSGKPESGNPSAQETASHQHNWVAQTKTVHHDAQYKTVHHDAVTHQVWHDAVTEEHYICNQCGADITSDPWGHLDAYDHGGYHSSYVTVKQGYYETVTDKAAYDEQVQVSAAWDETVTTGYKCSSCGATK